MPVGQNFTSHFTANMPLSIADFQIKILFVFHTSKTATLNQLADEIIHPGTGPGAKRIARGAQRKRVRLSEASTSLAPNPLATCERIPTWPSRIPLELGNIWINIKKKGGNMKALQKGGREEPADEDAEAI